MVEWIWIMLYHDYYTYIMMMYDMNVVEWEEMDKSI